MTQQASADEAQITPQQLTARAAELRELIQGQAPAAEELGHYTPAVHEEFRRAGFYNMLTPRRYGGLEVDLPTFAQVIIEVGRADPGTAWCLGLGQGHALTTASFWPQEAQDEVFDNPRGYFRASHSLNPAGTAKRVDEGWLIDATSHYQSGVAYASHATVSVAVVEEGAPAGPPAGMPSGGPPAGVPSGGLPAGMPRLVQVLIPEGQFSVLDNWGGDRVLGMRASGSNSIVVEEQVVPEHYACGMLGLGDGEGGVDTPGFRLHGSPMYLDVAKFGFFSLEIVSPVVGAAWAALDEYERLAQTRKTLGPGGGAPRLQDPIYQKDFGTARIKIDSAQAIVLHVAETMMRWADLVAAGDLVVTTVMDMGLNTMMMEAGEMACQAVELLFRSAGTSASGLGQPMQRYLRDASMYRTHRVAQYDSVAQNYGAALFGQMPADAGLRL